MYGSDSFASTASGTAPGGRPVHAAAVGARARPAALLVALVAIAAPAYAADDFVQHAAHEHGKATLDLAVDGGTVTMRLSAPAIDIVGFEHAPRTDAERGAAESANVVLKQHKALFAFPVAARCAATGAAVTPPAWGKEKGQAKGKDDHDHDHDHAKGKSGGDDHDHEAAHADYVAQWQFACAAPAALAFVDVKIPERFRKDLVVEANVVTETLQTRQTLRAGAVRVKLR